MVILSHVWKKLVHGVRNYGQNHLFKLQNIVLVQLQYLHDVLPFVRG